MSLSKLHFEDLSDTLTALAENTKAAMTTHIDKTNPEWWLQIGEDGFATFFSSAELIGQSVPRMAWDHFLETIPSCLKLYTPIHVIPSLLRYRSILKDPKGSGKHILMGIIKSTLFLSIFQTVFIFGVFSGRELIKNDHPIVPAIAGFISGLAVLFEKKSRRAELMLYCIPRALEGLYKFGKRRTWWRGVKGGEAIVLGVAMAFLMFFYRYESSAIKPTYLSILKKLYQ